MSRAKRSSTCLLWAVLVTGVSVSTAPAQLTATAEFQIESVAAGEQAWPAVGKNGIGDIVVAWDGVLDGSGQGIRARRFDSCLGFRGFGFPVNSTTAGDQRFPDVAVAGDGSFVVVWDAEDIFAQRFDNAGNPAGPEIVVTASTEGLQNEPSVAVDESGNFVVVWENDTGFDVEIFARLFYSDGTAMGTDFPVNTFTTGDQHRPSVAMDRDGQFVIAWQSAGQDGSGAAIVARRYDDVGSPVTGEIVVNSTLAGDQMDPAVATYLGGGFVVAWRDASSGSSGAIRARRFDITGSPASTDFVVSTTATAPGHPAVAMDAAGRFAVVWEGTGNTGFPLILGRHFSPGDVPLTEEFQINVLDMIFPTVAFGPDVAMDDDGDFVAVYYKSDFALENVGVYTRRYILDPVCTGPPAEVADLQVTTIGTSELLLSWNGVPDADYYMLHEDEFADGAFDTIVAQTPDENVILTMPVAGSFRFYLVSAASCCGNGPK